MEGGVAPVVRIPDHVFQRLQRLGTPLVDTPTSVIQRLLDHYEATAVTPPVATAPGQQELRETVSKPSFLPSIFLVPASEENLRTSLTRPVAVRSIRDHLPSSDIHQLRDLV